MSFTKYLDAFYHGHARHTFSKRDDVQYRSFANSKDSRVVLWSYNSKVIAVMITNTHTSWDQYLLLRKPDQKSRKAILARFDAIIARYAITQAPASTSLRMKTNSLIFYLPAAGRSKDISSIADRIKHLWKD